MTLKRARILEWMVLSGIGVFYLVLNSGTWLITPDSTDYVEGARALANLRGFIDARGAPITFFPPGASSVYAPAAFLPFDDYRYFNLLSKLLAIGFLGLSYLVLRRVTGSVIALVAVLLLALSQTVIFESTRILSDIPFSAMFMLTLWRFPPEALDRLSTRSALLLGSLVSCCYLLRTAGLFVYLGYAAYIALSVRHKRGATLVLVSGVVLSVAIVLALRASVVGLEESYLRLILTKEPYVSDSGPVGIRDLYGRFTVTSTDALRHVYLLVSNDVRVNSRGLVVCGLVLLGAVSALLTRRAVLHVFFLIAYAPAILLTESEPRYLMPVLPVLALLAFEGARIVVNLASGQPARRAVALTLLVVICSTAYWTKGYSYWRRRHAELARVRTEPVWYEGHEGFIDLVKAHRETLSPGDVIGTMHANVLYYFVRPDVRVWSVPIRKDVHEVYRRIRTEGTTYLYCDKTVWRIWSHLRPMIAAYSPGFVLVGENDVATIYRVVP